ncbi:MAG: FAD-binding protein [Myxococcota bacterium]
MSSSTTAASCAGAFPDPGGRRRRDRRGARARARHARGNAPAHGRLLQRARRPRRGSPVPQGRQVARPPRRRPYGAIDLRAEAFVYPAFTLGGLRIDPHGRVLTNASEPIPGLYAAGRTTSGVAKHGYSSGMSLGDGSFFGRRAGFAPRPGADEGRARRPGRVPSRLRDLSPRGRERWLPG